MKKTLYTMEPSFEFKSSPASRRRGSKSESTSDDTEGSLDYSSGASSGSSSFADILKVLEGPEMTADLAHYLQQQQKLNTKNDDKSIAESSLAYSAGSVAFSAFADGESQMMRSHFTGGGGSLAYSAVTDGESHMMRSNWSETDGSLHGADYVTTIPDDPLTTSTGGIRQQPPPDMDGPLLINNDQILFSPAEHADSMKLRKQRKKQRKLELKLRQLQLEEQPLQEQRQPPTPPSARPPKAASPVSQEEVEDDDIYNAKWWMLCFPDTFKTMTFKR